MLLVPQNRRPPCRASDSRMGSLKYESIRNQLDELMGANRNGDLRAESIISVRDWGRVVLSGECWRR